MPRRPKVSPDLEAAKEWLMRRFEQLKTYRQTGRVPDSLLRGERSPEGSLFPDTVLDAALLELMNAGLVRCLNGDWYIPVSAHIADLSDAPLSDSLPS